MEDNITLKEKQPSKFYCVNHSNQVFELDSLIEELIPYSWYWIVAEDLGRRYITRYGNDYVLYNYKMLNGNGEPKNITFFQFEVTKIFDNTRHTNEDNTIYRIRDNKGVEADLLLSNMGKQVHSLETLPYIGQCFSGIQNWEDFKTRHPEDIVVTMNQFKNCYRNEFGLSELCSFWVAFASGNDNFLKLANPMNSVDNRRR